MNFTINGEGLEFGCVISNVVCKGLSMRLTPYADTDESPSPDFGRQGLKIKGGREEG